MSDTTKMEVGEATVDEATLKDIQKEEENTQKLWEKANESLKAVKERNKKNIDAAKEKARLELVKPLKLRKTALLYKKALMAKKRLLGIEPEPEKASKVKFYNYVRFLYVCGLCSTVA